MQIRTASNRRLQKVLLLLSILLAIGLMEKTAQADPLFFSNVTVFQNNQTTQLDLFSNPDVALLGSHLTFSIDITGTLGAGMTDTLRLTYTEIGSLPIVQDFQIPLFGTVQPPFSLIFSINSPNANFLGVHATLNVDLLNSSPDFIIPGGPNQGQTVNSFTYSFNVAQPAPEPATVLTLVSGLVALGLRVRPRN